MPDTATAIGPVVRMCEDPDCHGTMHCPSDARDRAKITDRTLGVSEFAEPGLSDEQVCRILARAVAFGMAPDSHGTKRMIPDGCEFTVHKSTGVLSPRVGREWYAAIYSGPGTCIDDILGDAPEYDWEADPENGLVARRLRQMSEAADG